MKPTADFLKQFMAGLSLPNVKYKINMPVTIVKGPFRGSAGTIAHLLLIEPEIVYSVELEDSRLVEVFQQSLRRF